MMDIGDFRKGIELIENQLRYLRECGVPRDSISSIESITYFLSKLSTYEILEIPTTQEIRKKKKNNFSVLVERYSQIQMKEVEEIIENNRTPKLLLEAIAVGRFGFPVGSLKTLGSINNLRRQISSWINGEETHETIHRIVIENSNQK